MSANRVGNPIPRLTFIPSCSSRAARATIRSRPVSVVEVLTSALHQSFDSVSRAAPYDTLDEHARCVDVVGVQLTDLDDLLGLGDRDPAGRGGHRVEVPCRVAIDEVAERVGLPRLD